jgi:hypothetical protein
LAKEANKFSEQKLDQNEEMETKLFDFEKLIEEIKNKTTSLIDSQTVLSLLLAAEELKK